MYHNSPLFHASKHVEWHLTALASVDTEGRVCSVQDGITLQTHSSLIERQALLLLVISVVTCPSPYIIHTGFICFTRRTFECCLHIQYIRICKVRKYVLPVKKLSIPSKNLQTVSVNALTAEVAFPPAETDLMRVTNGHISSQEVTLMLFIMQVTSPYLITEVFWRNLQNNIWTNNPI